MSDTANEQDEIYPAEYIAACKAQATALKADAAEHGLRFDGYFVPGVAEWVLAEVERGRFIRPDEAVFVAMQVFMELEAYPDLRRELFSREMKKRLADPRPGIPAEEAFERLRAKITQRAEQERPRWQKVPDQS